MTDLVTRVARFFVAPADPSARANVVAAAALSFHAPVAMLLCPPRQAGALACGAALELASAARSATALACVWTGAEQPARARPSTRAARRLAAKLTARGLDASAAGRLAVLRLPAGGAEAAAASHDAIAAARVPVAVALAGPRCEATDCLLFSADAVSVVGGADDALAQLISDSLPVPGALVTPRPGALASLAASAGLAVTPGLRRGLAGGSVR